MRGDVDVAFEYYAGFQPLIQEHQIGVAATTGSTRAPQLPDVPTVAESGLPDYEVTSWNGLAAPAGVPDEIVALLNRAVNDALHQPEVQAVSSQFGMEARGSTIEDLRRRIATDIAKWAVVIDKAGIEKH
jgi:tripartite-type tricarboxylate transporter receptor subunit TctC